MRQRRWCRGVGTMTALVSAGCLMTAQPGHAFTMDARRLGMGSVVTPSPSLGPSNVAYTAMHARVEDHGRVIPLPLGLAQLAADFPTFDSDNENFDVLRIAELVLNPPFFLELNPPDPMNGDIAISIARDAMAIDFADARELLPQEPVRAGSVFSPPLVNLGLRGARTSFGPILHAEGRLAFDDALYGVLAGGQPLLANSVYGFRANASTMAGAAFNAGWAGGGWAASGGDGDGLYVGAYAKYILGFGFGNADTHLGLATADTIFGAGEPLDVTYEGWTRYSRLGRVGNGYGMDLGAAYRHGPIDVGVGLKDVGSRLHWGRTELEHSYLDQATGDIVTNTVASNEPYVQRLPMQTTVNVSWTARNMLLAADLTTSRWGTMTHLGAERRMRWLAVRGGLLTDERKDLQYACGFGLGFGGVWFDVGLQSHGFALTEERGWTLGTSFALR